MTYWLAASVVTNTLLLALAAWLFREFCDVAEMYKSASDGWNRALDGWSKAMESNRESAKLNHVRLAAWHEHYETLAWQIEGYNAEAVREVVRAAEARIEAEARELCEVGG